MCRGRAQRNQQKKREKEELEELEELEEMDEWKEMAGEKINESQTNTRSRASTIGPFRLVEFSSVVSSVYLVLLGF